MKVTVYINWRERKVISKKEYKDKIEKMARECAKSYEEFAEWLNDNYKAEDIWGMSENAKMDIKAEYCKVCQDWAEYKVDADWKPYEVEVDEEG